MRVTLRSEGDRVLMIVDGKAVLNLVWDQAEEVRAAFHAKIKEAEEHAKANQIIYDHAILTRAGFPVGLTSRPDMKAEVAKVAAWDTKLRRRIRPMQGVASKEVVSTPSVVLGSDLVKMSPQQKAAYFRKRYPQFSIDVRT